MVPVNTKREQNIPFFVNQPPTGEELRRWRKRHRLSQEELGKLLGVTREWIGKLERGDQNISAETYLTFEHLKREPKFSEGEISTGVEETQAPYGYGTPEQLRREIRSFTEETIRLAGEDVAKLGWMREQLIRHVSAPEHWDIHAKVIEQVLEEEHAEEKAQQQNQPPRDQGKAS